jgi:hypothetical protein
MLLELKSCDSINSIKCYSQRCQKLFTKMTKKHQGKLSEGIILRHDAALLHVAHSIQDQLNFVSWEAFKHPAYSLVLLSCSVRIFGMLRKALESSVFT